MNQSLDQRDGTVDEDGIYSDIPESAKNRLEQSGQPISEPMNTLNE